MPPALVDELLEVSPADAKGATTWSWDHAGTLWRLGAAALTSYVQRTGTCARIPVGHRELVDGVHEVALYQWVAVQRHGKHKGTLAWDRIAWLSAQPGWEWHSRGVTRPVGLEIDLGEHPHGTAKGAAARCPCQPCMEYSRKFGRQSVARHRAVIDGVPADEAARHLQRLQSDIAAATTGDRRYERAPGATAIATAAAVPVGVVRQLLAGDARPLPAAQSRALCQLTARDVLALFDTVGSRGRLVMSSESLVDAAPTLALLADLERRGFDARWIARELGYRQLAVKISSAQISRRIVDQVATLHARVGDLQAPSHARNERLARLDVLRAAAGPPTPTSRPELDPR